MSVENPWPIEGVLTPKETGYRASLDGEAEWLTEDNVDYLQAAVDRARIKYGEGETVSVVFTGHHYEGCSGFTLEYPSDPTWDEPENDEVIVMNDEKVEREYQCPECHSRATVRAMPDVDVFLNCSGENNEHRLVIMEEVEDNG